MYDYYNYNPYRYEKDIIQDLSKIDYSHGWNNQTTLGVANVGLDILGGIGNNRRLRKEYQDNMNRRGNEYTQIPYDRNSYKTFANDFYQSYESGGETDLWSHPDYNINNESEDLVSKIVTDLFGDESNEEVEENTYTDYSPIPIQPVVSKLAAMGLNPSSVNSGRHNEGSLHYQGRAVDLGLNTTFGGDIKKMNAFKDWFIEHGNSHFPGVRLKDETNHPQGQKVWSGSHLHLEI